MAQRRMFSLKIIDTDAFLDMSPTAQLLYFHLAMRADDDGFVSSPKKILKVANASDDDMKILIAKRYIIPFESGVCVIKDWKIHNYIQSDRYQETEYKQERQMLLEKDGKYELDSNCIQNVSILDTQVRLGKVRLGKVREDMSAITDDSFDKFWSAYPNRELKKKSQEIWTRKKIGQHLPKILEFIEKAKLTDRWKKGFVKQPPAFLNGECWNDDLASYNDKNNSSGVINVQEYLKNKKNG